MDINNVRVAVQWCLTKSKTYKDDSFIIKNNDLYMETKDDTIPSYISLTKEEIDVFVGIMGKLKFYMVR